MSINDLPKGLITTVKDVLGKGEDLYGNDLRSKYQMPESPSPEPEAVPTSVPETPAPGAKEED